MNVIKVNKDMQCTCCNYLTTQGYILTINNTSTTLCEQCKQELTYELISK